MFANLLIPLKVFVLGGAIIPLWPVVNFFGEKTVTLLTLDLYPSIQPGNSSFKLFEESELQETQATRVATRDGWSWHIYGVAAIPKFCRLAWELCHLLIPLVWLLCCCKNLANLYDHDGCKKVF